jgi:hypothetical protein
VKQDELVISLCILVPFTSQIIRQAGTQQIPKKGETKKEDYKIYKPDVEIG